MKCYIAGPFFDRDGLGIKEIEIVKKVLNELKITFYSPKDDNFIPSEASHKIRQQGFERNIDEINSCDFMIANTRDKDIGTLIELGFAYAKKRPIILFCPQIKGMPINLMLAQLVVGMSFDENSLRTRIKEFINGNKSPKFKGNIE